MTTTTLSAAPRGTFEWGRALRALRVLLSNPDDTAQVFTIIEALSGAAPQRLLERFRSDPGGQRLLASRADILGVLGDRAALERMPEGSLAHAYLAFIDAENITAGGLVAASVEGELGGWRTGDDFEYVSDRMRDTHDLWHTVTGFRGDVMGEAALLAFSVAQTRNPGVATIVLAALLRARDAEFTRLVMRGYRDGTRAAWLPAAEWEALLPEPLAAVRAKLRIEAVPEYTPMRSSWLRETGQLGAV